MYTNKKLNETVVCVFIVGQFVFFCLIEKERTNKEEDETARWGHLYICLVDKEKVSWMSYWSCTFVLFDFLPLRPQTNNWSLLWERKLILQPVYCFIHFSSLTIVQTRPTMDSHGKSTTDDRLKQAYEILTQRNRNRVLNLQDIGTVIRAAGYSPTNNE